MRAPPQFAQNLGPVDAFAVEFVDVLSNKFTCLGGADFTAAEEVAADDEEVCTEPPLTVKCGPRNAEVF